MKLFPCIICIILTGCATKTIAHREWREKRLLAGATVAYVDGHRNVITLAGPGIKVKWIHH